MTQTTQFDKNGLKFKIFNPKKHQLPMIDFTQTNGQDPLSVQEYYDNCILDGRSETKEVKYVIKYLENWIGFFSIDLTMLHTKQSEMIHQHEGEDRLPQLPIYALLIRKIGIDQRYRCYGIGKYIMLFCMGLAQTINKDKHIKLVIFKTTKSLAEKIYFPKYQFNFTGTSGKLVWAFKRIY
ncbi:hypothetical protein [Candidatus Nitrosocosmicus arcticus]|uniref:N-acetyltransferase domain-containing protein n=1 Tax=Candidatus Nitrosocosmicus arcticus TaxID=2035267 RepID=A0A557SVV2_9ARCH|nr:hypothetical protein [Candidatus Nitrosocosmicus arcticus]TVP40734.1 hypothetical protein NARC_60121 [Candidatus Nitrosocosmicus arcticus]